MLVISILLLAAPSAFAGNIEGAWRLTEYEFQDKSVPASGVMIFADGYFAMVYKMDFEGESARAHGGTYNLTGDELSYTIPWWVEQVAGNPRVFDEEVLAKGQVEQFDDELVIRFASGSVQRFKKLSPKGTEELTGAWLMDHYESRAKTGPASGLILYAGNNFALIYTMEGAGGKDGRAHAGTFQRNNGAMTLSVNWSLQVVGGVGSVDDTSSSRKTIATVTADSLVMELGGESVQNFHRVGDEATILK
jgi:hypothetical protein